MLLNDYFKTAKRDGWAIGHFNFSTADQLKAIIEAAAELKSPIMVATSEGEAKFFGRAQAVALVKAYQAEGHQVFLSADHHKSSTTARAAIDAGYDTVLIDASRYSYQENIDETKKVVDYAKLKNPEMMVEGELGYLRGESQVQTKVEISSADYTKPAEAREFVNKTGVNRLAIVCGNIHGIVTEQEEHLDINVLKKINQAVPEVYLVLHGASGLDADEVKLAIKNGITNIHINTELRLTYHDSLHQELEAEPSETTPYKFLNPSFQAMKSLVKAKLEQFGSVDKI